MTTDSLPNETRAARVHRFGGPEVIEIESVPLARCDPTQVLVEVHAASVGPWDGWIRAGHSVLPQPLPLTLGSDIAGRILSVGDAVQGFSAGDLVYGSTNHRFTGGYANYAVCDGGMLAPMPSALSFLEAASAPTVSVTAWQMLFKAAGLEAGNTVLIHGSGGNVGGYAVQLAQASGIKVLVTIRDQNRPQVLASGAMVTSQLADAAIDLVGGETQASLFQWIRAGGRLISAVSEPDSSLGLPLGISSQFMLVQVDRSTLERLAGLFQSGALHASVGLVLPLSEVEKAHQILEGNLPQPKGKVVLQMGI